MADSRDKIGNEKHILSPSFHPPIGLGQMGWANVEQGGEFDNSMRADDSSNCITHTDPTGTAEKGGRESRFKPQVSLETQVAGKQEDGFVRHWEADNTKHQ